MAIDEDELLPVEEAFAVSISAQNAQTVRMIWNIADGYYMYRGKFRFESLTDGITLGEAIMPSGEKKTDEFFGPVETYRGSITIDIPLIRTGSASALDLRFISQGCADLGVCYPPNRITETIPLPALASAPSSSSFGASSFGSTSGTSMFGADALPVDEAFRFEMIATGPDALLARWTIAEGYYLYRDKIEFLLFDAAHARIDAVELPPGEPKFDEHFGDVLVYYDQVEVPVRLTRTSAEATTLSVTGLYQGCKDAGICYPPVEKILDVSVPEMVGFAASETVQTAQTAAVTQNGTDEDAGDTPFVSEQDRLANALSTDTIAALLLFYGFGLLLAFTPCVFPMVPILSGIIAGQGSSVTSKKAFVLSLVYVLAMALTYTMAGVVAGLFGYNLQAAFQNPWVLGSFAAFFVLLSLAMFGFYELQLPTALQSKLNSLSNKQSGGSLIGVAIMGFLSALIVGPCVAPPLAAALIYISQTGDPVLGGLALFALSMGMGTPLIVIGTSAGKLLPRAGGWMNAVKAVFGVGLLALAIWMLERIIPPSLVLALWGILALSCGVYLGALEPVPDGASGWRKLWKSLGIILLVVGAAELIGAAAGGRDVLKPLSGLGGTSAVSATTEASKNAFQKIKSLDDLEGRLSAANGAPIMLDFYADWCVDCKRMEKYTFPEAPVVNALQNVTLLKADVTANDAVDQALMKELGVIGPPAILFFGPDGKELRQYRLIGYKKPAAFVEHIERVYPDAS